MDKKGMKNQKSIIIKSTISRLDGAKEPQK
jgi:hypothetical protein